jgi:transposase
MIYASSSSSNSSSSRSSSSSSNSSSRSSRRQRRRRSYKLLTTEEKWAALDYALRKGRGVRRTARRYGVHESTTRRLVALYKSTSNVVRPRRHGPRSKLTELLKDELFDILVSSPRSQLKEHLVAFEARSGVRMPTSSFSKAVKRLGFSRKRLRAFARKRDAAAALAFKSFVVAHLCPEWLFFLDETSKDRTSLRRDWGYALRGMAPVDTNGYAPRSTRCSSLCGFDINGFVNWYTIRDTFSKARFMEACELTVVCGVCYSHTTRAPCS